jgi:hypothetical protein
MYLGECACKYIEKDREGNGRASKRERRKGRKDWKESDRKQRMNGIMYV